MKQIGVSFEEDEILKINEFASSKSLSYSSAIRMLTLEAIKARGIQK